MSPCIVILLVVASFRCNPFSFMYKTNVKQTIVKKFKIHKITTKANQNAPQKMKENVASEWRNTRHCGPFGACRCDGIDWLARESDAARGALTNVLGLSASQPFRILHCSHLLLAVKSPVYHFGCVIFSIFSFLSFDFVHLRCSDSVYGKK